MVVKEAGGGKQSMSLRHVSIKKKRNVKTHYLRPCDFHTHIVIVKTLGFEATDAEKPLTLHTISSKTEIMY